MIELNSADVAVLAFSAAGLVLCVLALVFVSANTPARSDDPHHTAAE